MVKAKTPRARNVSARPADNVAQRISRSYQLAVEDPEFIQRDEMRAVHLELDYSKADLLLHDAGIRSTLIVFGSSRTPSPEAAEALAAAARTDAERAQAKARERDVAYYQAAREFARIASQCGGAFAPHHHHCDNVIATGGGPGIMEAANRGAFEIGAPSIGFNISLPNEQQPNPYTTPELTFRFHYFAIRKLHLAMRARALVVFPGGFGTLDELFEILTLQQTGKAPRTPVVLYDEAYWTRIVSFEGLVREGMVSTEDLSLFAFAETPEEAWARLVEAGVLIGTTGAA